MNRLVRSVVSLGAAALVTTAGCALVAGLEDRELRESVTPPPDVAEEDRRELPDVAEPPPPPPTLLIGGQAVPRGIITDGTDLYWVNGDGTMRTLSLLLPAGDAGLDAGTGDAGPDADADAADVGVEAGADSGPIATTLDVGLTGARELYQSPSFLYVPFGKGSSAQTFLKRVRKDGSDKMAVVLATVPTGEVWEASHASLNDTHAFLTLNKQGVRSEILRTGGDVTVAQNAASPPPCAAAERTLCHMASFGDNITTLHADGSFVYAALEREKTIVRVALATGIVETFASGQPGVSRLAADLQSVFWGTSDGLVARLDKNAVGSPPIVMATGQGEVRWIEVDGTEVFWTAGRAVRRAHRSLVSGAGVPMLVGQDQNAPFGIALSPTVVIWTNSEDGTIVMAKR